MKRYIHILFVLSFVFLNACSSEKKIEKVSEILSYEQFGLGVSSEHQHALRIERKESEGSFLYRKYISRASSL